MREVMLIALMLAFNSEISEGEPHEVRELYDLFLEEGYDSLEALSIMCGMMIDAVDESEDEDNSVIMAKFFDVARKILSGGSLSSDEVEHYIEAADISDFVRMQYELQSLQDMNDAKTIVGIYEKYKIDYWDTIAEFQEVTGDRTLEGWNETTDYMYCNTYLQTDMISDAYMRLGMYEEAITFDSMVLHTFNLTNSPDEYTNRKQSVAESLNFLKRYRECDNYIDEWENNVPISSGPDRARLWVLHYRGDNYGAVKMADRIAHKQYNDALATDIYTAMEFIYENAADEVGMANAKNLRVLEERREQPSGLLS